MATEVRGAAFVWTQGMKHAELHLSTEDGAYTFDLEDRMVVMLFDQMWRRRVDGLAMESAKT